MRALARRRGNALLRVRVIKIAQNLRHILRELLFGFLTPAAQCAQGVEQWIADRIGGAAPAFAAAAPASFELVLLDPPFDAGLARPAAQAAARIVVPGGFVYVESGEPPGEPPEGLVAHRAAKAGAVHVALWRRG